MNASDTRRGIAKAFAMWSDVSPFSFREVPEDEEADIKIGMSTISLSFTFTVPDIKKKTYSCKLKALNREALIKQNDKNLCFKGSVTDHPNVRRG